MPPFKQNPIEQMDTLKDGVLKRVKEILPEKLLSREELDFFINTVMAEEGIIEKYGSGRSIAFRNAMREDLYLAQGGDSFSKIINQGESLDVLEVAPVIDLTKSEPSIPVVTETSLKDKAPATVKKSSLLIWQEEQEAKEEELARLRQLSEKPLQGELPI